MLGSLCLFALLHSPCHINYSSLLVERKAAYLVKACVRNNARQPSGLGVGTLWRHTLTSGLQSRYDYLLGLKIMLLDSPLQRSFKVQVLLHRRMNALLFRLT